MRLQPLAIAVYFAAQSVYAAPQSPFLSTPPHLIDIKSEISKLTALPNVLLQVDDSGSMGEQVGQAQRFIKCQGWQRGIPGREWGCRWSYDRLKGYVWNNREQSGFWGGKWGGKKEYYRAYPRRMDILKEALLDLLNNYDPSNPNAKKDAQGRPLQMHWNMITLNGTARDTNGRYSSNNYLPVAYASRQYEYMTAAELKPYISRLYANGGTPSTERYIHSVKTALEAMKYHCQKNYIIVLSDGDANNDNGWFNHTFYPSSNGGMSLFGYLPYYYNAAAGGSNNGIAYFSSQMLNRDWKDNGTDIEGNPWKGKQNVQTYTVGFGSGLSATGESYLRHGGAAEGGVQTYFQADNAQSLVNAFEKIFSNVDKENIQQESKKTTSVTAPVVATTPIDDLAATFTLDTKIWSSEIRFHQLDENGQVKTNAKGEPLSVPADYTSQRKIILNNGGKNYWIDNSTASEAARDFGFANLDEFRQGFLPWIARRNVSDKEIEQQVKNLRLRQRTVSEYRVRTENAGDDKRQMGDVLDADVVSIDGAKYIMTGANDGMVYLFEETGNSNKPYALKLNYIPGAMEREGSDDTLMKNMPNLAKSDYGLPSNPHMYGVNGGISFVKTPKYAEGGERHQRTVAFGAMGQGGRGVYALNISGCERTLASGACNKVGLESNTLVSSVPLWESQKGQANTLGYTIGRPFMYGLAKTWNQNTPTVARDVILAGFVANGHQAANQNIAYDDKPSLYIYNMLGEELGTDITRGALQSSGSAGELITKLQAQDADSKGALASPIGYDIENDGIIDVLYAGDYFGDLYRFDLRGNQSDWTVKKIYDGNSLRPITAAPVVYRDTDVNKPIIAFGTGSDLYEKDRYRVAQQGFFAIYDDLTNKNPAAVTNNDLAQRSLTTKGDKRTSIRVSELEKGKKGWWIPLIAGRALPSGQSGEFSTSEMVVTQPSILLSTVFFTTRTYKGSRSSSGNTSNTPKETCSVSTESDKSSGSSQLMAIDIKTGALPDAATSAKLTTEEEVVGVELGSLASSVIVEEKIPEQSAVNVYGQIGSGELPEIGNVRATINGAPKCVSRSNPVRLSYTVAGTGYQAKEVLVPYCSEGVRLVRTTTREIK